MPSHTPTASSGVTRSTPCSTDHLICSALDEVARRHPSLLPLRQLIPASLEITDAFAKAYATHDGTDGIKSQLFRALILDASVIGQDIHVGVAEIGRLVRWWQTQGFLSGRQGSRARAPASIAAAAGANRSISVAEFASRHLLAPWWRLTLGDGSRAGWLSKLPAEGCCSAAAAL